MNVGSVDLVSVPKLILLSYKTYPEFKVFKGVKQNAKHLMQH